MQGTHREIAQELATEGSEKAEGHNMVYKPSDNGHYASIEGYGWATYAVKVQNTVLIFWDWYSYSQSTKQHLRHIERAAKAARCNVAYLTDCRSVSERSTPSKDDIDGVLPDEPRLLGRATDKRTVERAKE